MTKRNDLIIASLLFFFISCANDPIQIISPQEIKDNLSFDLSTPSNSYSINNDQDTTIALGNGVQILVPSNSFVDTLGNPIEKDIELRIQAAFTGFEIFSEPISTISNEGLLETKGMLEINAYYDNTPLELGEGKSIDIYFPGDTTEYKNAQIFYGVPDENGIIEWEAETQSDSLVNSEDSLKQEMELNFGIEYFAFSGFDFNEGFFLNDPEMQDSLRNWLNLTATQKEILMDNAVIIHWILFSDGDFEIFGIEGNISKQFKKLLEQRFNNIPKVRPSKRHNEDAPLKGRLFLEVAPKEHELSKKFRLKASKLGWVNCDILFTIKEPIINMMVKSPNPNSLMKLVFNEYKTIVSGLSKSDGYVYFESIPKNVKIQIVTLYSENEETMLSITESVVQEKVNTLNEFKPVDKQNFEKEINSILQL